MLFSKRTSHLTTPNALSEALTRARGRSSLDGPHDGPRPDQLKHAPILDLTVSNPTLASLPYATDAILQSLAQRESLVYEPAPLGMIEAREAVALDWQSRGINVHASHIALTASTSEAYATLFKVLCDPGDEVLVPTPSYPLLGYLAEFESVMLKPYPLVYAGCWHIDLPTLKSQITPRTKAIVIVNPNNPTGSYLKKHEFEALLDLGIPIISDEVFATYPFNSAPSSSRSSTFVADTETRVESVATAERSLVFALCGLSKLAGLPQLKAAWIGVAGSTELVQHAMQRLELVLDAYLSVASPVQHALGSLLKARAETEAAIRTRAAHHRAVLAHATRASKYATLLHAEGGWYAVIQVPNTQSDEQWAVSLLDECNVHVQPGYFYDITHGAYLVISLLTPPIIFEEGIRRLVIHIDEHA